MRDMILLLATAVTALALGVLFFGDKSGTLIGIPVDQLGGFTISAAILVAVGGAIWYVVAQLGTAAVSTMIWLAIGLAVLIGFSGRLGFF